MTSKLDSKVSKFISLVLRHKPEVINARLEPNGYLSCILLLKGINDKFKCNYTMEDLTRIVNEDDKQRYSFDECRLRIRANQGHSIDHIDVGLKECIPAPRPLYHGTSDRVKDSILENGIKAMSRNFVHLSKDIKTALEVGKRHGNPIIFEVDTNQMFIDMVPIYISENDVYLTKFVDKKYLKLLQDKKDVKY